MEWAIEYPDKTRKQNTAVGADSAKPILPNVDPIVCRVRCAISTIAARTNRTPPSYADWVL